MVSVCIARVEGCFIDWLSCSVKPHILTEMWHLENVAWVWKSHQEKEYFLQNVFLTTPLYAIAWSGRQPSECCKADKCSEFDSITPDFTRSANLPHHVTVTFFCHTSDNVTKWPVSVSLYSAISEGSGRGVRDRVWLSWGAGCVTWGLKG